MLWLLELIIVFLCILIKEIKNILVIGEELKKLDGATITAEAKYPIDFTESEERCVLSLHFNGSNFFLFVISLKIH